MTTKVVEATGTQPLYERVADDDDYEEFEWVAVEQKFAARPIETEKEKGWAFFELDAVDPSKGGAPRAHVDALRLLAVFLAHWDNKPENQRLVCLSKTWPEGTTCREPFWFCRMSVRRSAPSEWTSKDGSGRRSGTTALRASYR